MPQKKDVRGNAAGVPRAQRRERRRRRPLRTGTASTVQAWLGWSTIRLSKHPQAVNTWSIEHTSAPRTSLPGVRSARRAPWRPSRGPAGAKPAQPLAAQNAELRRRLTRSESELEQARRVIEAQGNVCALLGELHGPR